MRPALNARRNKPNDMKTIFLPGCVFMAALLTASAGSRNSANYSIPADVTDSGGRRTTTAAYSNDGSVGGIAGLSTVVAPARTAKQGYPGQLLDVTNIVISANPTSINENSTRQLAARLSYDDGTVVPLAAASVGWGVVSGPLSGVNASGVASATNVYQDTPATVFGTTSGRSNTLGLLVINTGIDDFASYAGDGIDDAWQVLYFGLNSLNAGPGGDPDGDGQTNYFEYVATTVPTNALSKFRLAISSVPPQPWVNLRFSPISEKRLYTVQGRPLVDSGLFSTILGDINDVGDERIFTDTNAVGTSRFYKVLIEFP
jgi:hypothetical protein